MVITLDKLPINKIGILSKINTNDNLKRRLLDLGFVKGTYIKPLYKSPFNDPTCFLIKSSFIALRNEDSKNIFVYIGDDYNELI